MGFIKSPNLPQKMVRLAAVGNHPSIISTLHRLGTEVIVATDNINIQEPVRNHIDMTLLHLGEKQFITYDAELAKNLNMLGADAVLPQMAQKADYPQDIGLNCLCTGNLLLGNTTYCAGEVLGYSQNNTCNIINVKQGYARCSTAVIDERSFITADKGIAEKLSGEGFDVLRIREGFIELPGYNYGFVGGCCGKIDRNRILFSGDLMSHPDGKAIIEFIESRNIEILTASDDALFDFGGIVQILE